MGCMALIAMSAKAMTNDSLRSIRPFVSISIGTTMSLQMDNQFPLGQTFSLDAGMWFNQNAGLSIDGTMTCGMKHYLQSHTILTREGFSINGLLKVTPRRDRASIALKAGLGYDFMNGRVGNSNLSDNSITANTGVIASYMLNSHWQFSAQPLIHWTMTTKDNDAMKFNRSHAELQLQLGLIYTFGSLHIHRSDVCDSQTRHRRYHHEPVFHRRH